MNTFEKWWKRIFVYEKPQAHTQIKFIPLNPAELEGIEQAKNNEGEFVPAPLSGRKYTPKSPIAKKKAAIKKPSTKKKPTK